MSTTHDTNPELIDECTTFLRRSYRDEIHELGRLYPRDRTSLVIDHTDLFQFSPEMADDLRERPDTMLPYLEEALQTCDLAIDVTLDEATIRVRGLSAPSQLQVPATRAEHRDRLIAVQGQVRKVSQVKARGEMLAFECQRCGTLSRIPQMGATRQAPHECQGCERQGPFQLDFAESEIGNQQLIRLEQPPEQSQGGSSGTLDVHVDGDMIGAADPGDRVTVTGVLRLREASDDELMFDEWVEGHHIETEETQFNEIDTDEYTEEIAAIAGHEAPIAALIESFAPELYGYEMIKEAVILQLFGGTSAETTTGKTDRGNFHVLAIGDPGTGKSTLLDAAHKLAPRSTMSSGKGASKAGMTAAAVRDDFGQTEWGLEAGALVMADQGVACIDEIDKVPEEAVSSLHRALEAQQVEINKAGINAALPARTSLLAAGNPEFGRFDQYEPIAEQIDLDPPLMSRFDLMYVLQDSPDPDHDYELAEHALEHHAAAIEHSHGDQTPANAAVPIGENVFRAYIAHARQEYHPMLTDSAREQIQTWYADTRADAGEDSAIPVTARYLDAARRLSQASARARLSDRTTERDVDRAIRLVTESLQQFGVDPETGELDADVIETGRAKNQRDRIKSIKSLIAEIEQEYESGAPVEIVLDRAEELGIDVGKTEHEIEKLTQKGVVYEPRSDHPRTS